MKSEGFTARSWCPIWKLGKLNNQNNFFERVPGVGLRSWCLVVPPRELPHEWLHALSLQYSLFLSQTTDSFLKRVPRAGLQGWPLWCYPGSYPVSGFIFPIWYDSFLSIFPLVFKMKRYQSYKMSVSKFWAMTKVSTKIDAFAHELNSNILD